MKSICLIIPYFGKFKNYFPLFLKSCSYNPTVDWLVFTDTSERYVWPENVHRIDMSLRKRFRKTLTLRFLWMRLINYAIINQHMVRYCRMN